MEQRNEYTKEQIEAMTPEQLKRAVATDVMGLSIYHYNKDVESRCYYMLWDENMDPVANDVPWTWHNGERKTEEEAWADCPDYLGDIVAAWEVVDKLKIAIIPQSEGAPYHLKYLARIEKDFKQDEIQAFSSTDPEAICKASLLAVME